MDVWRAEEYRVVPLFSFTGRVRFLRPDQVGGLGESGGLGRRGALDSGGDPRRFGKRHGAGRCARAGTRAVESSSIEQRATGSGRLRAAEPLLKLAQAAVAATNEHDRMVWRASYLDTPACCQHMNGMRKQAIETIELCIELAPDWEELAAHKQLFESRG